MLFETVILLSFDSTTFDECGISDTSIAFFKFFFECYIIVNCHMVYIPIDVILAVQFDWSLSLFDFLLGFFNEIFICPGDGALPGFMEVLIKDLSI